MVAVLVAAIGWLPCASPVQDQKAPLSQPTAHLERQIEGWTVQVDARLLNGEGKSQGKLALEHLGKHLFQVRTALPGERLERLRKVTIWLDQTCGDLLSPQYHPDKGWLTEHGYPADHAKCVHIPNASYWNSPRFQLDQPWAVLHELAHAYHDQVLGFDNLEVKALWEKLKVAAKYESVLHVRGDKRKHYALTNPMEFFAEMSEAYVGQNDFFPFNAGELKAELPEVFAYMEKNWGPRPNK